MKREDLLSEPDVVENQPARQSADPNFQGKASLSITTLGMALLFFLSSYELKTMGSFPDLYQVQKTAQVQQRDALFIKETLASSKPEIPQEESKTRKTLEAENPYRECEGSLSVNQVEEVQEALVMLWKKEELRW